MENLYQVMSDHAFIQDDPFLGIGWVDVEHRDIFGLHQQLASTVPWENGIRSVGIRHDSFWKRLGYRNFKETGEYGIYAGDYKYVPRFRVVQVKVGDAVVVQVMVGSWIKDWMELKINEKFELDKPVYQQFKVYPVPWGE